MKTGILILLLATQVRVATGQTMPEKDTSATTVWTLDKCLEYASAHNRELLSKARSVAAVVQDNKAAKSRLAPEITVKAGVDNYWKIPVQIFPGELVGQPSGTFVPVRMGTPWMGNYGAEADLPLVDVQAWQDIKLARLQLQAGQSEYHALQLSLLKNVRMAFYNVQQQQEYVTVTAKLYDNYRHIHELIALQFDKGFTDKIAYNQSAVLLKTREETYNKAKMSLQEACLDLQFWMGAPLGNNFEIVPVSEMPPLEIAGFNPDLLPDRSTEQLKVQVAQQRYRAATAANYPTLHARGSYQQLGFGDQLNFITHSPWYTVGFAGIQLRLPLTPANLWHKPRSQKAQWEAASIQFKHYEAEQQKKYLQEKMQLEQASRDIQLHRENIQLAEENETLSTQKIDKGIIDMIQLKEIQKDLYDAQEKLNEARIDFFKHYTELNYLQNK